ncbi:MAG: hypothetical protein GEU95_08340 [Rhizobiales bacterium]|nr:hypothetical protein [Hyphomicrobiales bacterium]
MANALTQWISHNRLLAAACTLVITAVAFFAAITPQMIEKRAAFERQIEEEIAEESRIACEKWGMQAATPAHISCVAELKAIRANHDNRRRTEDFGL